MKWYNIELSGFDAERFSAYLTKRGYKFETSGCYNLTHFEVHLTKHQAEKVNKWISEQLGE